MIISNIKSKKIAIVFGTRPEIIKLASIIKLVSKDSLFKPYFVHTGQHYDYLLDKKFFEDMGLPEPHYNLKVGSGSHAIQTGKMMVGLEKLFLDIKPDVVLVQGDTNSALSGAIVASKLHIKIAHVEAGIRCFDKKLPEEVNRMIIDQISDFYYPPTKVAKENLIKEGVDGKFIRLFGNTVVDAVNQNLKRAKDSNIIRELGLEVNNYIVLTMHRAENTDDPNKLATVIETLVNSGENVVYPIHPRTKKMITEYGLEDKANRLMLIKPLGFLDFLKLCSNSKFIVSDSGGLQEECTIYKKPIVIIRGSTERPEILGKFGFLVGTDKEKVRLGLNKADSVIKKVKLLDSPYGSGTTGGDIVKDLKERLK